MWTRSDRVTGQGREAHGQPWERLRLTLRQHLWGLVDDEWTSVTLFEEDDAMPITPLPTIQNGVLSVDRGSLKFLTQGRGTYAFGVDVELRRLRPCFPCLEGPRLGH